MGASLSPAERAEEVAELSKTGESSSAHHPARGELQQAAWYYVANLSSYILPFLTFTVLARTLGPVEWGRLAVFHSFGLYASQVIEYGFTFGASRDIARSRTDGLAKSLVMARVNSGKLLLAAAVLAGGAISFRFMPGTMHNPILFPLALAYAVAQGSSLLWYFQGNGRIAELAVAEAITRSVAAALTIVAVREPADAWRMIALNTAGCAVTTVFGYYRIRREIPLKVATLREGIHILQTTFPLFVFRGASSLYSSANVFLFGLFGTPAAVGHYAGAERAYKGLTALLHPLMQLMYARVNHSLGAAASGSDSQKVIHRSAAMTIATGLVLGAGCLIAAPLIVWLLLGPKFAPAEPVLRVFGGVLFAESAAIAFGIQWMLPLGFDKQLTALTLIAGLTNVAAAYFLAAHFGATGMALAVLSSQTFLAIGCIAFLRIRGSKPSTRSAPC